MKDRQRGRPKVTPDSLQRDMIVNTARRLFIERGFGQTKTEDITARCKISKQTLYRLFPAKSALFAAVVESHQQIWLDLPRTDDDLPLADVLLKIFQVDISEEADRERFDVIRLVIAEKQRNPELGQIIKSHGVDVSRAALADWLKCQQQKGHIKSGDSLGFAQMLIDMVFGAIMIEHFASVPFPTRDERRRHIQSCVDIFLNGVAPKANITPPRRVHPLATAPKDRCPPLRLAAPGDE